MIQSCLFRPSIGFRRKSTETPDTLYINHGREKNDFLKKNRSLNFTIKSRKVTPASGLQMSINLGISGMICMHASQGFQGIANLALKPNLLGNLGKNPWKNIGVWVILCSTLPPNGWLTTTNHLCLGSIGAFGTISINQRWIFHQNHPNREKDGKRNHRIWGIRNNLTCRGKIHAFQIFPVKMFNHRIHILGATP